MPGKKTAELRRLSATARTVSRDDEDIRGRDVKARNGEDLGNIDDLLIDPEENKVRFLVVASGGFPGIGETKSFIPIDAVLNITDDEVRIRRRRDDIAGAPVYNPNLVAERDFYENVYSYYGYVPYWAPGYVYPAYPYPPR